MLSNEIIEEIAIDMASKKHSTEYYSTKYAEFKKDYPMLFIMCSQPGGVDIDKLRYMMSMWSQVQTNAVTQDKASEKIGQVLFDEYVKPVVKDIKKENK